MANHHSYRHADRAERVYTSQSEIYGEVFGQMVVLIDNGAAQYWQNAIKTAEGTYGAVVRRSYARFVFNRQKDAKDGRRIYQETIDYLENMTTTNAALWETMWTYLEWAKSEASMGKQSAPNAPDSRELLASARKSLESIRDTRLRADGDIYIAQRQRELDDLLRNV